MVAKERVAGQTRQSPLLCVRNAGKPPLIFFPLKSSSSCCSNLLDALLSQCCSRVFFLSRANIAANDEREAFVPGEAFAIKKGTQSQSTEQLSSISIFETTSNCGNISHIARRDKSDVMWFAKLQENVSLATNGFDSILDSTDADYSHKSWSRHLGICLWNLLLFFSQNFENNALKINCTINAMKDCEISVLISFFIFHLEFNESDFHVEIFVCRKIGWFKPIKLFSRQVTHRIIEIFFLHLPVEF